MLPDRIKKTLRNREDGKDTIGVMINWRTVKRVWRWLKKRRGRR